MTVWHLSGNQLRLQWRCEAAVSPDLGEPPVHVPQSKHSVRHGESAVTRQVQVVEGGLDFDEANCA